MKKTLKIFLYSTGALAFILILAIGFAIWFAFTPEKLTPFIRKQAAKAISCQADIGEVELTFFSTFPSFGLKITNFALYHHSSNDTIVKVDEMVGTLNTMALWHQNELVLNELSLSNGNIHLFTDSLGHTNYDILLPSDAQPAADQESSFEFKIIDVESVKLNNINLTYLDEALKVNAEMRSLWAKLSGSLSGNQLKSSVLVSQSNISLTYDTIQYLSRTDVALHLNSDLDLDRQHLTINNGSFDINKMGIDFNGDITNDTTNQSIVTDLHYSLRAWPIDQIIALVPPAFHQYLKGIQANGKLTSTGHIKGAYSEKSMPVCDINLVLEEGELTYPLLKFPLSNISASLSVYADWQKPDDSKVSISQFVANTPQSAIATKGTISRLFGDVHCNLENEATLSLDEVNLFIPKEMKTNTKGIVKGNITTDFSLSQLEAMALDKMKFAGTMTLKNVRIAYDTLNISTEQSLVEFALPNPRPSGKNKSFVFAKINSTQFELNSPNSLEMQMKNAHLQVESSDVRDTTKIPVLLCAFDIKTLSARMDTNTLVVANPMGKFAIHPSSQMAGMPEIELSYKSDSLLAKSGKNKARFSKLDLSTTVINNTKEKEIIKQWIPKGNISLDEANIQVENLNHPIEIPALQMDFTPEVFNIQKSMVTIHNSDFQLSGILRNLISYVKGDSLLKGDFAFNSSNTDITELMMLTNGIGSSPDESPATATSAYMVPKGMDISLKANIDKAIFGNDTATNINGKVQVQDGKLVLDGISFVTPAAKMQLTALYRTPRKNHLFAGFDFHMMDVEISELLKMIPDIDSMMPMLRSFDGKGEFHIAAETYLDSMYNIKKSTLRGASSIKGQDLILMDGETFSEIAKTLKFNKKTENRVDSLSAEFTIFKQEIDIYPFLIVMDKYKAVVAGQHNLDLSFNYHISVVDCPLPIKLGIDVKGTIDDLKYRLAACKYKEYYRPSSRKVVENKQLEIRKMIRDALLEKLQSNKQE